MSRGARVRKEEYDFIKSRLANGEKAVDIAKQFKRSQEVVRNIDYSTDFDDFLNTPSKELRARKKKAKQKQIAVEDLCPLEENNTPEEIKPTEHDSVTHNPLVEGAPAYFINRTDDVICQRIADVAIQTISALLEIHKRGRE